MMGLIGANAVAGALERFPEIAGSVSALLGATQFGFGALAGVALGLLHDGTAAPMGIVIGSCGVAALARASAAGALRLERLCDGAPDDRRRREAWRACTTSGSSSGRSRSASAISRARSTSIGARSGWRCSSRAATGRTLGVAGRRLLALEERPGAVRDVEAADLFHFALLLPSRAALGRQLRHLHRGRGAADRRLRPPRQRGALSRRPGRPWHRALPRPAARGLDRSTAASI